MRGKIQKWGNSLAVRIPRAFAKEARLEQNREVDLSVVDGKLVIEPAAEPAWTLDQLLKGVTEKNLHTEIITGPPVGKEGW